MKINFFLFLRSLYLVSLHHRKHYHIFYEETALLEYYSWKITCAHNVIIRGGRSNLRLNIDRVH